MESTNYKAAWEELEGFLVLTITTMIQNKIDPLTIKRMQVLQDTMESIKGRNTKEIKDLTDPRD